MYSRKLKGRRGYIYRRGQDWIVGYDTGSAEGEAGHEELSYIIPGLLQLGGGGLAGGGGHAGGGGELPGPRGWLYLSQDRDWLYDPSVSVSPRHARSVRQSN